MTSLSKAAKRPTKKPRTSTCLRFPEALHQQLEQAAADREVSINWLVNRAVEDFLPRLLPASEIVWTR